MGIGAVFGRIFGTDKAIESAVSSVSKGLDALVYTDEEKAQDAAKERAEARSMIIDWMAASKGQNIARRILALGVFGIWSIELMLTQALLSAGVFATNPATKDQITQLAQISQQVLDSTTGATMLVLGFYFAAPYMSPVVEGALKRFGGKKGD